MSKLPISRSAEHSLAKIGSLKARFEAATGSVMHKREPGQLLMRSAKVILALDCSGSMEGNPLDYAKRGAISFAIDAIKKGYKVGIVAFGCEALTITQESQNIEDIKRNLSRLTTMGSTNMTKALQSASNLLTGAHHRRAICLVTDGFPNDREETLASATRLKANNIEIITLGTEDADHAFLQKMASRKDLAAQGTVETLQRDIRKAAALLTAGA